MLKEEKVRNVLRSTILALALVSMTYGVNLMAAEKRLSMDGQAITGHQIIEEIGEGYRRVEFSTAKSVPGDEFWALIPGKVLAGEIEIITIYWHGDDAKFRFENHRRLIREAFRVDSYRPIAVRRPHSGNKYQWRQNDEIRLQLALVDYLSLTFGIKKFNLTGHSGGALVAIAVAQERPNLTAMAGLSSPKLAVKDHYLYHEGGSIPGRYWTQYDPIYHIEKLSAEIPILIVYDSRDQIVQIYGVTPYTEKAAKLGLKVKLVLVQTNDYPHHYTQWRLGKHLKKPENHDFRLRR